MQSIIILIILLILLGFINLLLFYNNLMNCKEKIYNNLENNILKIKNINTLYDKLYNENIPNNILNNISNDISNNIPNNIPNNILKIENNNTPPERVYIHKQFNIPTRGYPDSYQLIGYLMNTNGDTIYNIYGRQKYPGADLYEYFIHAIINNNNIKIPLNINKELYDGQYINFLKDNYIVKIYPYELKYIP